jgi:hypothetical protein
MYCSSPESHEPDPPVYGFPPRHAADARLHARRWFTDLKDHSLRRVRELPEGLDIDADAVQLVGELLLAELDRPDH